MKKVLLFISLFFLAMCLMSCATPEKKLLGKWYTEEAGGAGIWFKENNGVVAVKGNDWTSENCLSQYWVNFSQEPGRIDLKGIYNLSGYVQFQDDDTLKLSLEENHRPPSFDKGKIAVFKRVGE